MGLLFTSDEGHGWLAVPVADYPDVLRFGTGFGYLDRAAGVAYLEEDCEVPAFLAAYPAAREGIEVRHVFGYASIRSLPSLPRAGVSA